MPPRKRKSPQRVDGKEQWLRSGTPARSRPWAYEELLFESSHDREQAREHAALVAELERESDELAGLYQVLDAHLARIARLERRLKGLTPAAEEDEPPPAPSPSLPRTRAAPVDSVDSRASLAERSYSLARCEGFQVDSPAGPVGYVEGLRFISRIDQPDLLEVRGGRFGRQLVLIPIEQVEEVRVAEELVLVHSAPTLSGDLLGELVDRFRRALRFDQAAS